MGSDKELWIIVPIIISVAIISLVFLIPVLVRRYCEDSCTAEHGCGGCAEMSMFCVESCTTMDNRSVVYVDSDQPQPFMERSTPQQRLQYYIPPQQSPVQYHKAPMEHRAMSNNSYRQQLTQEPVQQRQYIPERSIQQQYVPDRSIQRQYVPDRSIQRQFVPERSIQQQYVPDRSIQRQFVPERQFLPNPENTQRQYLPDHRPQSMQQQYYIPNPATPQPLSQSQVWSVQRY